VLELLEFALHLLAELQELLQVWHAFCRNIPAGLRKLGRPEAHSKE